MHYVSTRDASLDCTGSMAIAQGLSKDGGLFVPASIPKLPEGWLDAMLSMTYAQRAAYVMGLFLDEFSKEKLLRFSELAYDEDKFPAGRPGPVRRLDGQTACLELWHGPTCAFKDMALQMLPHLLTASLQKRGERRTACILAATSGDTGKAALEGFRDVPGTCVLVFYPREGVSEIQGLQMRTQQGENVGVCAVEGNFDDAQTGVKQLFSNPALAEWLDGQGMFFSSANSINWGRVLPQIAYYISACCDLCAAGGLSSAQKLLACVPTGNFGNILAAWYAREMGAPLGRLVCASNCNHVLTDFLTTGRYDRCRPFRKTSSPSMDILISSNLERLLFELSGRDPERVRDWMERLRAQGGYQVDDAMQSRLARQFAAGWCDEAQTRRSIARLWEEHQYLIDPHTAAAFHVLEEYRSQTGDGSPALVVSTASPFKFCGCVLEALGEPAQEEGLGLLEALAEKTGQSVPPPLAALREAEIRFDCQVPAGELEQYVRSAAVGMPR